MAIITSANVASAIVKLVAADALPALVGNLVMGNLVNRDYEPVLAQAGDTVNIPIPPVLVANNIAEGGTVQPQNPNLGNAQIVLNTHAEATFQIPDVTKVLAVPDLLQVYMQPAVVAIAQSIETSLLNLFAGFTANTPVGTPGTPLVEAVIDQAESALFTAKVPSVGAEVPGGGRRDLFRIAADRTVQRIPDRRRSGPAGLDRRHGGEDQRLLRDAVAVHRVHRQCAHDDPQPGFHQAGDRPGDPEAAAAVVRHGRSGALRGDGQFRHARSDELPAEYIGAAVHGGRAVRLRGDPQ